MGLTDEQVGMLIDEFVLSERAKPWRERRLRDHERWTKWVDPSKVDSIPDDELRKHFLNYFNEGAGRHPFNAIYRDRIVKNMAAFRATIKFLFDESVPLEQRLNEVLETKGRYHLQGIGKGLATSLLMDLDPTKYATWNNKTEMGLEALGRMPEFEKGDSWGQKYKKVMQEIGSMKSSRPDISFIDFDHLLHVVAVEEEGIEAVRRIKEGGDLRAQTAAAGGSIIKEAESMEFAMEKYLEEFIEANFDKINFGAKLELYQDEDSTGRQFPTSIGPIDLLAFDKDKKEFVVIELKKGRASDAVIGQVLRYMGWVKENLAEGRGVKGIVIQRELDEKLQYALKMIPGVSAFLYSVSFDIREVA
ncbi:MAG: endonuclease NucS domain-containing protein [Terriglobia bacterium]|jgi:hypothetical protein